MPNLSTVTLASKQPLARALINHLLLLGLAAAALLASASAWADPPGRVGRIAQTYGAVWIFDAEQGEWIAAQPNLPLTAGDRLSSERDARAELQIGSATLHLDGGSELEVSELNDSQVGLHLHHGSLALRLAPQRIGARVRRHDRRRPLHAPGCRPLPDRPGEQRQLRRRDGRRVALRGRRQRARYLRRPACRVLARTGHDPLQLVDAGQ